MTSNSNREEAKAIWIHMSICLTQDGEATKRMPGCCVELIATALSHARKAAIEECAKIADEEAEYWLQSDSYKEAPTNRAHTAQTISRRIRTLSQQEDGKDAK